MDSLQTKRRTISSAKKEGKKEKNSFGRGHLDIIVSDRRGFFFLLLQVGILLFCRAIHLGLNTDGDDTYVF